MKDKEENLNAIKDEVDIVGDRLGYPIDEGIKETVVFLKALGISTTGSCEGHTDSGLPWPWVGIAAANEPEERWENQNSIFEKIAQKYNIRGEDVKNPNMDTMDAWQEAMIAASKNPETADYKNWGEKNKALHNKTVDLLREFYEKENRDSKTKISVGDFHGGNFRISSADAKTTLRIMRDELSKDEKEKLNLEIPSRQAEMKEFTEFLERKYWES